MILRVFPSHLDEYNSIYIDTDDLSISSNQFHPNELSTIYIDDLISDLISKN